MAKILAIDDDESIVDAIRLILEKEGHEVAMATTREAGLKALEAFKPDLMIVDVMMEHPDDGIVLAQEVRRRQLATPILMLTNAPKFAGIAMDKQESIVPVDVFLEKPVTPAQLVETVTELLGRRSGGRSK